MTKSFVRLADGQTVPRAAVKLPVDRSRREAWTLDGGRVVVDPNVEILRPLPAEAFRGYLYEELPEFAAFLEAEIAALPDTDAAKRIRWKLKYATDQFRPDDPAMIQMRAHLESPAVQDRMTAAGIDFDFVAFWTAAAAIFDLA